MNRELGPNAQKLFIRFMSREAIPDGGDFMDGVKFILDESHRRTIMERALANMDTAIKAVVSAPDNPYGKDEEVIAGVILNKIQSKLNEG